MNQPIVDQFCDYYRDFSLAHIDTLERIYHPEAIFEDPAHRIVGVDEIKKYFTQLISNVSHCRFNIDDVMPHKNRAFINWQMTFAHPRLNRHQDIIVAGVSRIEFDAHITKHRDYFDMGAMLYEHIPLLKQSIGLIKRRMSA